MPGKGEDNVATISIAGNLWSVYITDSLLYLSLAKTAVPGTRDNEMLEGREWDVSDEGGGGGDWGEQ